MIKKNLSIQYYELDDASQLSETEQNLVARARQMTENAYAPYSEFFVGAAILLKNGKVVTGSNQENGAYPSGLCAERVAMFAASAAFPGVEMEAIAISAKTKRFTLHEPVPPCGACRQSMMEYETLQKAPIRILLSKDSGKVVVIDKVSDLLPLSFSGDALKK